MRSSFLVAKSQVSDSGSWEPLVVLCLRKKSFFGYFRTVLELYASFCDLGPSPKQQAAPAGFVEGCWLFFIVVSKFPPNYVVVSRTLIPHLIIFYLYIIFDSFIIFI